MEKEYSEYEMDMSNRVARVETKIDTINDRLTDIVKSMCSLNCEIHDRRISKIENTGSVTFKIILLIITVAGVVGTLAGAAVAFFR